MFSMAMWMAALVAPLLLVATVVLGLGYPLAVWAVAHVPGLSSQAEGSAEKCTSVK